MAIEDILLKDGLITKDQLAAARESQKNLGEPLEKILVERGYIQEEALLKALAKEMHTSFVSLAKYKVDDSVVKELPAAIARKYKIIPLFRVENKVIVATSDPTNFSAIDAVRDKLGVDVEAVLALQSDIDRAISEHYRGLDLTSAGQGITVEIVTANESAVTQPEISAERLQKEASGEQVVAAVNNIIFQAVEDRASDIHFEPSRNELRIRFRIDGELDEFTVLPKNMHLPIISRIKIMGGMDIAERRVPQDGRVRIRIVGKELDMRIATYPTMFGEASAVRLLGKDQLITLEGLGFQAGDLETFTKIITRPHGIFLVTGPTGSGKSTTLYAALQKINSKDKHIISVEDPIEHEIAGIDQQQVNIKSGLTFAASIRSMLREDPDVIMVGEIRDGETADIAIRSAMTGHLVLSTLHTNTALGAIVRLVDLGVEPFLISSSMVGVMAQRLVRRICQKCKKEVTPDPNILKRFGSRGAKMKTFRGTGCKYCRKTGYTGRIGIFELISVNEQIKDLILAKAPEAKLREAVIAMNCHSMLEDGIEKIDQGVTTIEEVAEAVEIEQ